MKIRSGFVSNSSSSSFLISKQALSPHQIELITNYPQYVEGFFMHNDVPGWSIEETKFFIKGSTSMDNFDMSTYLERIGVDDDAIEWEYGHW